MSRSAAAADGGTRPDVPDGAWPGVGLGRLVGLVLVPAGLELLAVVVAGPVLLVRRAARGARGREEGRRLAAALGAGRCGKPAGQPGRMTA